MLDLGMPFEVLRSEFDAFGYDLAIEANGVLRHIQLKATVASGARVNVDVQLALAEKPGACVVWIFVDPKTFRLGPFLWFGGTPGRSLPSPWQPRSTPQPRRCDRREEGTCQSAPRAQGDVHFAGDDTRAG
jgi:hypothetical protein